MKLLRVTVIIPFCNYERHLGAAIRGVLDQTYPAVDLILVDDGSTDGSAAIARQHVPPARYVRRPNGGAGAARNNGIELASGDLIAFCDADDVWAATKLELQIAALHDDPSIDVVFCGVAEFWDPERPSKAVREARTTLDGASPSAMLVRRAAFDRVGPFAEGLRVAEWVDWYVRMRDTGLKEACVSDVLVARRLHRNNNGLVQGATACMEYVPILRAHLHRRRSGDDRG
jgi:glycosyltransferase involved in cell wall biosynthesis